MGDNPNKIEMKRMTFFKLVPSKYEKELRGKKGGIGTRLRN